MAGRLVGKPMLSPSRLVCIVSPITSDSKSYIHRARHGSIRGYEQERSRYIYSPQCSTGWLGYEYEAWLRVAVVGDDFKFGGRYRQQQQALSRQVSSLLLCRPEH